MNLCIFGCGRPAIYTQKNGRMICSSHYMKCPVVKSKAGAASGESRRGKPLSPESIEKRSEKLRGVPRTDEVKKRISETNKRTRQANPRDPWNKGKKTGQVVWNKGLRKRTTLPIIPGDDPIYTNLKQYRNRVSVRTRKTYLENKEQINPNDYPLGKCGVAGAYQIDHVISVREGFEKRIPVEQISDISNLQIIPWLDNIRKYDGTRNQ